MRSLETVCASIESVNGFVLRPWDAADAFVLATAWADPDIAQWNPVPPDPSVDFAQSWIAGTVSQNEASVGIDVVLDKAGDVCGEIGLQIDVEQSIGEVGFWLRESSRGSGVSRALLSLAQELATELELRGLIALVDAHNAAALGALARAGWTEIPTTSERRAFAYRCQPS